MVVRHLQSRSGRNSLPWTKATRDQLRLAIRSDKPVPQAMALSANDKTAVSSALTRRPGIRRRLETTLKIDKRERLTESDRVNVYPANI